MQNPDGGHRHHSFGDFACELPGYCRLMVAANQVEADYPQRNFDNLGRCDIPLRCRRLIKYIFNVLILSDDRLFSHLVPRWVGDGAIALQSCICTTFNSVGVSRGLKHVMCPRP